MAAGRMLSQGSDVISIETIAACLDRVDVATAQTFCAEAAAAFRAKAAPLIDEHFAICRGIPADEFELRRAAVHESAHAVVAFSSGLRVGRVCVRASGGGCCEYTSDGDADCPATLVSMASVDLAGTIAEIVGGAGDERQFLGSYDLRQARLRLEEARAVGFAISSRAAAQLGYCAVLSSWPKIERVATALRALGALNGIEVSAMCGRPQ